MRVNYLELRNYRRFKELKLQFPDGIVGILGLNGVGKTTIIEAVAWALFGNVEEVVRTSREGVRRAGAGHGDSCSAMLEFELGGSEYRIEREMSGKSLAMRAELRSKGRIIATGDKDVRRAVEKLIGMDHKSFFTSVFARQKELNALQNVAPGERKKVVLRMLRIDSVDDVLAEVRADKKEALARIVGAEKTLLTEEGLEKEKVLADRIPQLSEVAASAAKDLEAAEQRAAKVARDAASIQARRDELRKDVEALNAATADLRAKQSSLIELRAREKGLASRLEDARTRLKRMPALEKDEERWKEVSGRKDALEKDRARDEKARLMRAEMASDEKEEASRLEDIAKAKAGLVGTETLVSKLEDMERASAECQRAKAEISGRMGELKAKATESQRAADEDTRRLEDIRAAGKKGQCPTCERTLEEAYDLLVGKLEDNISRAREAAREHVEKLRQLESELEGLTRKEEALRKKRSTLDQQLMKTRQLEESVNGREKELSKVRERLTRRKKDLLALGDIVFSEQEYGQVRAEQERLRKGHDEYTELKSLRSHADSYSRDLEDVRSAMKKGMAEEAQFRAIVESLGPKKALYESSLKELDGKMVEMSSAKDDARRLSGARDRAKSELDQLRKELEEIARVKKVIESDRKSADDLGVLEEVVANFKDSLIGRVAPTLSELASKTLESMTEGRYGHAELNDNYEMQIEDQGTMYPIDRYSGGEADLANLSLRLAISRIIADRTGAAPISFLILDEVFGSQDPNRKRSVMMALSRLSAQFRQIFLITHIEDVKDAMNYVIRVEEHEDGTSGAELAS